MTDETAGIGMWAIVELFGHSQVAGYVTEEQIAGQPMLKVEVPAARVEGEGSVTDPFVRYIGAKAIYAITPCAEHEVQRYVDVYRPKHLPIYLPQLLPTETAALPAGVVEGEWGDDEDPQF